MINIKIFLNYFTKVQNLVIYKTNENENIKQTAASIFVYYYKQGTP